jgi:UDP-N-acetylmuramoyl-L-alanyl-D-glutamate--2,6-diaminopimelate ligase
MGAFNVSNILACVAALLSQGFDMQSITTALQSVAVVPGRLEAVSTEPQQPLVIIDYAHTPDGLRQALTTLRTLCSGELICVVGCGGDRDRGKRPLMGKIAAELSDRVILTNDNPRSENPLQILRDISSGIPDTVQAQQIPDRGAAIAAAISNARQQDVVLIAGKGHEDYQIVGEQVLAFSDREQALTILRGVRK